MELDMRGQECPLPTVRAVEAMKRLRDSGQREDIVVITDDPTCAADIPHQAGALGYQAASHRGDAAEWTITLRLPADGGRSHSEP